VHGNALTLEVWGHWFTPAHVLGGWARKLRERRTIDVMRSLMGGSSIAGEPGDRQVPPASSEEEVIPEAVVEVEAAIHDVAVAGAEAEEAGELAVLERPVQARTSVGLADMFDEIVSTQPRERDIFDVIDQMALF
jgi:hypothetical protein